jgi:ubiquinone/menaquinone biosynthesis C-methylase UbiE
VGSKRKRSHRLEKLARIYDDEILPVWSERFGRMLLRGLEIPDRCQVLDVACGTGYPAVELLRRMNDGSRLIAIDAVSAMLDVARKKVEELGARGVFFRTESADPKLGFASDVYDLVVCNLGLPEMADPKRALIEFARVTKPGGQLRVTVPLAGTFQEFYDIYREVLTKHDKHDTLQRLADYLAREYPTVDQCYDWLAEAGVDGEVAVEEFSMLFRSSREFFFAPVIEYGPLPKWKQVAGKGQEMQDVFWYIKEAIDAYFGGRAFEVTVRAGCLKGKKRFASDDDETGRVDRLDPRDRDSDVIELGTDEIDVEELVDTVDGVPPVVNLLDMDDEQIDAFVDGARRPDHLDDD